MFMVTRSPPSSCFFFFNDTATTEIYTLSLHDALPISAGRSLYLALGIHSRFRDTKERRRGHKPLAGRPRSEEHTSELQSQSNLVCRLLLEKKKKTHTKPYHVNLHPRDRPTRVL